jgi:hypothetical protein
VGGVIDRRVDPTRITVLEAAEASERALLGGSPSIPVGG